MMRSLSLVTIEDKLHIDLLIQDSLPPNSRYDDSVMKIFGQEKAVKQETAI